MRTRRKLTAVLLSAALVAVGCGDDDDDAEEGATTEADGTEAPADTGGEEPAGTEPEGTEPAGTEADGTEAPAGTGGGEAPAGMEAALAMVEQYRDPNQPIGITIPLDGEVEPKTFAYLQCELESCTFGQAGAERATDAIGWELVTISMESANPGPAFQQAIDAGVDYIAATGLAPSLYEEQAQAAADAGISILSCFDTTPPNGPETNIWTQCGDTSFVEKSYPLMANWAIVDSDGAANILIVSIPDFAVLKAGTDAFIAELEKNCPDCEYTELDITIPQLQGGEVPAAVASQLQGNSDINYVFFAFGSLPAGVTAGLESAGLLEQVTVYGQDFSAFGLEEIVAGTMGAWSADPKAYASWLMVDAAARLSLGMELEEEREAASLPTFLVEDAETAQSILDDPNYPGDWNPPTMEEDFKALWGV